MIDLLEINKASALLAIIFGVIGLLWILVYICLLSNKVSDPASTKLLGSALVLALAFGANTSWTYALSIFVIATLVTELQFLEKLAAMFTNNGQHLEALMKQSPDGRAEKVDRLASEMQTQIKDEIKGDALKKQVDTAPVPPNEIPVDSPVIVDPVQALDQSSIHATAQNHSMRKFLNHLTPNDRVKRYYDAIRNELVADDGPLPGGFVSSDLILKYGSTRREIDFVVEFVDRVYLVETKQHLPKESASAAIMQCRENAILYSKLVTDSGKRPVTPVLVVPEEFDVKGIDKIGVMILRFNESIAKFVKDQAMREGRF